MAFCSKCGNQLGDGVRFCGVCGNQSGEAAVLVMERPQAGDISKMDRQALLGTFTEAGRVLSAYEACRDMADEVKARAWAQNAGKYNPIDGVILLSSRETKEEIKRRDIELAKRYPEEAKKLRTSPIVALVGLVVGVVALILTMAINFSMPLVLLSLAIIIGPLWYMESTSKKWKQLRNAHSEELVEKSDVVLAQARQVNIALTACERSLALNSVPPAYRYTYAMEQMARLVQNLLADSWKECAVLYEDHMHKLRMEAHAEETQRLAELSAFYAKQAKSSAGAAALFSGLNFFFG